MRPETDINYQPLTGDDMVFFFDEYSYRPRKPWPGPWRWIALLAIIAGIIWYEILFG